MIEHHSVPVSSGGTEPSSDPEPGPGAREPEGPSPGPQEQEGPTTPPEPPNPDPVPPPLPRGQLYRVAWIFYLVLAVVAVVWLGLEDSSRTLCPDSGVCLALFVDTARWPLDLGLGLGAALVVIVAWHGVCRVSAAAAALERRLASLVGGITTDEALAIALLSGFSEELFFRGAVQGSLGWLLATVLFALMHTGPGRALRTWSLYAFVVGLAFAGMMEWRQNLLAPVVAHVAINGFGLWRLSRATSARLQESDGRP